MMSWSSQPVRCHDNAHEDTCPDIEIEADRIRIILWPVVNTPLPLNIFRLSTEYYAKRAHTQRVDVAFHKSASEEDNYQETYVHSASASGCGWSSRRTWRALGCDSPQLSCFIVWASPQPYLWHLHWLASVRGYYTVMPSTRFPREIVKH
jgi:hypothetical protein